MNTDRASQKALIRITGYVAELGSGDEVIIASTVSVTSVFEPAVSVTLVVGEGNTTCMLHTTRLTLVNILVFCSEVGDVSTVEVHILS